MSLTASPLVTFIEDGLLGSIGVITVGVALSVKVMVQELSYTYHSYADS